MIEIAFGECPNCGKKFSHSFDTKLDDGKEVNYVCESCCKGFTVSVYSRVAYDIEIKGENDEKTTYYSVV